MPASIIALSATLCLEEDRRLNPEKRTPRGADHVDVAQQHTVHLQRGNPALGEPDHDETTLGRQAPNALVESLAADGIQDRVDPETVVLSTQRRDPVALGIEDPMRARSLRDVHLVGTGRDRDHLGPEPTGNLYGRGADAAGRPVDRDAISGQDASPARQGEMRGVVVHDEPGCRLDAQAVRDCEGERRLGDSDVRETAQHGEGHHPVAFLESGTLRRGTDPSRDLDTGHERQRRLHLIFAAGEQQIGKAHARGRNFDDDATGILRLVDLDQMQTRRALEALNLLCAHLISSVPVVAADDATVRIRTSGPWGTLVTRGG